MRSVIVTLLLISPLLRAQTAEQKPTFAVASIEASIPRPTERIRNRRPGFFARR